jgi:cation:H+ antiporter
LSDPILITAALILGGLVLLVVGGEYLVRGAVAAARSFGVSPLMIGLTLVAFGTSTPELLTSVQAAIAGAPGVAVGNVVGSNICNILLILGLTAVIRPVFVEGRAFRRDGVALAVATAMGMAVLLMDGLSRVTGAIFLLALAAYVVIAYRQERETGGGAGVDEDGDPLPAAPDRLYMLRALGMALGGLLAVMLGAKLLVDGAIDLAQMWGVSDTLIGLTIVAVGTSLPELVASAAAALRGQSDVAFGNIVGSNLYNIWAVLGGAALIHPFPVDAQIMGFDAWVMLAATALLIGAAITGARVCRWEGVLMLGGYAGYVGWLAQTA